MKVRERQAPFSLSALTEQLYTFSEVEKTRNETTKTFDEFDKLNWYTWLTYRAISIKLFDSVEQSLAVVLHTLRMCEQMEAATRQKGNLQGEKLPLQVESTEDTIILRNDYAIERTSCSVIRN